MNLTPVSGLHFAVLTRDGALIRYPVVGADENGDLMLAHFSEPRLVPALDVLGDSVATAMVSATLPREQAMTALHRHAKTMTKGTSA